MIPLQVKVPKRPNNPMDALDLGMIIQYKGVWFEESNHPR